MYPNHATQGNDRVLNSRYWILLLRKERMAPLSEEAVPLIKAYLAEYHGNRPAVNSPFIYTVQHEQVSRMSERNIERIVKKYADLIRDKHPDLPKTVYPHMLRRTHATGLYRDGVAIEAIASTLGHARYSDNQRPLCISFPCTETRGS